MTSPATTANSTPILVAGLCYLLVTIPLGFVVRRLEAAPRRPGEDEMPKTTETAETMASDRPEIEIRGLHKSFGDNEVLRGIDLEVGRGEVVCVIGPSGSGKSTLLRCVNLLEEPNEGQVFVGGTEVTDPDVDIDAVRRRIGMVFQQFNLFPHLTVTENLTLPQRRVLRRDKARGRGGRPGEPGDASVSPTRRTPTRRSCPAASSSASRSPAPWRWAPR